MVAALLPETPLVSGRRILFCRQHLSALHNSRQQYRHQQSLPICSFTLTVNGSGFASGDAVSVWPTNFVLPTTFISATQLQATVPASTVASDLQFHADRQW